MKLNLHFLNEKTGKPVEDLDDVELDEETSSQIVKYCKKNKISIEKFIIDFLESFLEGQ